MHESMPVRCRQGLGDRPGDRHHLAGIECATTTHQLVETAAVGVLEHQHRTVPVWNGLLHPCQVRVADLTELADQPSEVA